MNADSVFQIGASHVVCQDYSLAGQHLPFAADATLGPETSPYVILSDGCSSSRDTDVGARLLAKAAEQTLLEFDVSSMRDPAALHKEAARRALLWADLMNLRPQAVDATLLTAYLDGNNLMLGCTGDGAICLESWSGAIDVYVISYPSGYPFYPAYSHQPERLRTLEAEGRSGKEVRHLRGCAPGGSSLFLQGIIESDSPTEVFTVRAADFRYAALFSDGIHSFYSATHSETSKRVEMIAMEDVLRNLICFKNSRGAFVERRMKRFLKDCQATGWLHMDDLAFGALHLGV